MKKEFKWICFVSLICLLALTACALSGKSTAPFEEQVWELQYYRKSTAVEGANATIQFSDGIVRGSTGCNSFSGKYNFSGEESGDLHITSLAVTEIACLEPQGLMDQEAFFLETLNNASSFEYSPSRLTIYQSGHEALTFKQPED